MTRSPIRIELLVMHRVREKMSQSEFAKRSRVPEATLKRAEAGEAVNPQTIRMLAKFLGITAHELAVAAPEVEAAWREDFQMMLTQVRRVFGKSDALGHESLQADRHSNMTTQYVLPQYADREVRPGDLSDAAAVERFPVSPAALAGLGRHVVILAGPGYGKSSLIKWLAVQLAAERRNDWRAAFDDAVPFPLVLREMKLTASVATWDHVLAHVKHTQFEGTEYCNPGRLEAALAAGRVVVMLDGLDEIDGSEAAAAGDGADPSVRKALHRAIWDGMRRYPDCRWLATSRVQGYEIAPLELVPDELAAWGNERRRPTAAADAGQPAKGPPPDRRVAVRPKKIFLVPFDDDRIHGFAELWYARRETTAKAAHERAEALCAVLGQAEDTRRLARVPSLLTLIAQVYRDMGALPSGRVKLYMLITRLYLETIDAHKKLAVDEHRHTPEQMEQWLESVAYAMQRELGDGRERREILVDRTRLLPLIQAAMADDLQRPVTEQDAGHFLTRILRRSGLLVEQGEGKYAFAHLSFLEYFAARYVRRKTNDALRDAEGSTRKAWLESLWAHLADRAWHETFLFLCQILKHDRDRTLPGDIWRALTDAKRAATETDSALAKRLADGQRVVNLLLLQLANDPSAGFDAPASREAGAKTLADEVRACIDTLDLGFTELRTPTVLAPLTNLRRLDLRNRPMSDPDMSHLAGLTKLKVLNLRNTGVTNEGVKHLRDLSALEELYLGRTSVTNDCVTSFVHMKALKRLHFDDSSATGAVIRELSKAGHHKTLVGLSLRGLRVTPEDAACLKEFTNLEALCLNWPRSLDARLEYLGGLIKMKTLNLSVHNVDRATLYSPDFGRDSQIDALLPLENLTTLYLEGFSISDVGVAKLAKLPKLAGLDLEHTNVEGRTLHTLAKLPLEWLDLRNTNINNKGVNALADFKHLDSLYLGATKVDDACVDALAKIPALIYLDLTDTHVTADRIARLLLERPGLKVDHTTRLGRASQPVTGGSTAR